MPTDRYTAGMYARIIGSSLFRTDGKDIDLCAAIIDLCDAIEQTEDTDDWIYIGESWEIDLPSFLVGAYWALTEWASWNVSPDDAYRAMSAIGGIYSPGMSAGPEPDSSESYAYDVVNEYFSREHAR